MLADYQNLVARLSRDDTGRITPADIDDAIGLMVTRYSKDSPRRVVEDVTSAGGQVLDLPVAWVAGFSDIEQLEYPIGKVPPELLEAWEIYQAPSGESILIPDSLEAGEDVRVTFGVFHTLDAATDTIPLADREAAASYAAAILCDQLASLFSGASDSTIAADSVDHGAKASEFASRARALRKRYYDEMGVDPKRNLAAGVVVDLDLPNSQGRDRLTHPGRLR